MYYIEYESGFKMIFRTFGLFLNALNRVVTIDEKGGNLFNDVFKGYGYRPERSTRK